MNIKLFSFIAFSLALISSSLISNLAANNNGNESGDNLHGHGGHHSTSSSVFMAPAWEALNSQNEIVASRNFQGEPYVLILHLGHACLHCSKQLNHFNTAAEKFSSLNTDLIAVGLESTKQLASAQGSADPQSTAIKFAVDPTKEIFRQFQAIDSETNLPQHATFLIDGTGRIRWSDMGEHPFMESEVLVREINLIRAGGTTTQEDERPDRPKIFLDKSARIVAYQLKRLSNERLLLVERKTTDPKYKPVFEAILTRAGMSPQYREEALAALATLNKSDAAGELLTALTKLPVENLQDKQTADELTELLIQQPKELLNGQIEAFANSTDADSETMRRVGFAGLVITGNDDRARSIAKDDSDKTIDYLGSISLIKDRSLLSNYSDQIWQAFKSPEQSLRVEAIKAMAVLPEDQEKVFNELEPLITENKFRVSAVATLSKVPEESRDPAVSKTIVSSLLSYAKETLTEDRTSDQFLDAMQLADQLLKRLPADAAKQFRSQLSEVSVRVVRVTTLEDEMQYDVPYFAVEAGRPVQIILDNVDLMAHNLVLCQPGKLRDVAIDGFEVGPKNGLDGKPYVPKTDDVLAATKMIQAHERGRITFEAPTEVGDYPYVCTFPQHWLRMYGVMVVVNDLDQWLKNPVAPADPLGNKRQLVKKWTVDELVAGLEKNKEPLSLEAGKTIFTEATCAACHKLGGEGGAVGPALDEVVNRWKGDKQAILREIIVPSHRIDEKYSMHKILTLDGQTIIGIIQSENEDEIELLDNPESKETIKVIKDDIDEMVKTSKSIMPKALMDNYTQQEIFELLHYIEASQKN